MSAHPFYVATYNGRDTYDVTAADRLLRVQRFSLEQCQAALELPSLQTTVRTALERRIRKLNRGNA